MQVFYYFGPNPELQSGHSWKIWKINRSGVSLTVWWGAATIKNRRPQPVGKLQTKTWQFSTVEEAKIDQKSRIREKTNKGYKPWSDYAKALPRPQKTSR